jgi:hypothetical protein
MKDTKRQLKDFSNAKVEICTLKHDQTVPMIDKGGYASAIIRHTTADESHILSYQGHLSAALPHLHDPWLRHFQSE